jgi:hypothetical protein
LDKASIGLCCWNDRGNDCDAFFNEALALKKKKPNDVFSFSFFFLVGTSIPVIAVPA